MGQFGLLYLHMYLYLYVYGCFGMGKKIGSLLLVVVVNDDALG